MQSSMRAHYETTQKVETKCESCGSTQEHDVEVNVRINGMTISERTFRNDQQFPIGRGDDIEADCDVELVVNET